MSEPKSPKPMPSIAEINAYLEQSAARTRMRLPLAKGNALPTGVSSPTEDAAPGPATTPASARVLPVAKKALPTQSAANAPAPSEPTPNEPAPGAWAPFADDSE